MRRTARRPPYAPRLEPLEGRALLSNLPGERLLVGFTDTAPTRPLTLALRALDARVVESYTDGPRVVELPPGADAAAAYGRLARVPGVRYVEANGSVRPGAAIVNDPMAGGLWGLDSPNDIDINAPQAWAITSGGPETIVAVIDGGIDLSHPDLAGRIWTNPREIPGNGRDDDRNGYADDVHGWNFQRRNNDVRDQDGHGTHVAGTIAASANNGIGVIGAAPGVRIMPLKFFGPSGNGAIADAVEAIYYAANHGAKVINASWTGANDSRALEDAIAFANSRGVVFVTAAGNAGSDNDRTPNYPANSLQPNVLSVAAIGPDGALADFSNYGARTVDLAAPGVSILSTVPGGGYEYYSGTSMATPHVSAVVALVASREPALSAAQLAERVRASARPLPRLTGRTISGGMVDALRALTSGATAPASATPAPPAPAALRAADLRAIILGSDEFYAVHGGTPEGFVDALYRSAWGRPADPAGLALWAGALRAGWTRQQIARAVLGGEETYRTTIARWFVDDLRRPAATLEALKHDPSIVAWAGRLAAGTSPDLIHAGILASEEFYAIHGSTPEAYIDALYRAVLGRPAEPAGLAFWAGVLRQGRSRGEVALLIVSAPEARRTTIARWFVDDLRRTTALEALKDEPIIISWAQDVLF